MPCLRAHERRGWARRSNPKDEEQIKRLKQKAGELVLDIDILNEAQYLWAANAAVRPTQQMKAIL